MLARSCKRTRRRGRERTSGDYAALKSRDSLACVADSQNGDGFILADDKVAKRRIATPRTLLLFDYLHAIWQRKRINSRAVAREVLQPAPLNSGSESRGNDSLAQQ